MKMMMKVSNEILLDPFPSDFKIKNEGMGVKFQLY